MAVGTRRLTGRQGDGRRRRDRSVSYKNYKSNILNVYNDIQKTINNLLGVIKKWGWNKFQLTYILVYVKVAETGTLRYIGNCLIIHINVRNWW